jgi:hypothetical protein
MQSQRSLFYTKARLGIDKVRAKTILPSVHASCRRFPRGHHAGAVSAYSGQSATLLPSLTVSCQRPVVPRQFIQMPLWQQKSQHLSPPMLSRRSRDLFTQVPRCVSCGPQWSQMVAENLQGAYSGPF